MYEGVFPYQDPNYNAYGSYTATTDNWRDTYTGVATGEDDMETSFNVLVAQAPDYFAALKAAWPTQNNMPSFDQNAYQSHGDAAYKDRIRTAQAQTLVNLENQGIVTDAWLFDAGYGSDANIRSCWYDMHDKYLAMRPAGAAGTPSPTNRAYITPNSRLLSWATASGATSYDVWVGASAGTLVKVSSAQAGTSYLLTNLVPGTQVFWRIDSKNGVGTTTGTVWNFTPADEYSTRT